MKSQILSDNSKKAKQKKFHTKKVKVKVNLTRKMTGGLKAEVGFLLLCCLCGFAQTAQERRD